MTYKLEFDAGCYRARANIELILTAPLGEILARLGAYQLTYGTIRNLRAPIEDCDDWIVVDSVAGLAVGDEVEFRNEYQLARANLPILHRCRIVDLGEDGQLRVDNPPTHPALREQQGVFLLSEKRQSLDRWSCQRDTGGDATVTWSLSATSELVDVVVRVELQRGVPGLQLRFERKFRRDLTVLNEQVRVSALPPLVEVYRKNRQVDRTPFQRHYNVNHEGGYFEADNGYGVLVYGGTDASSLELRQPRADATLSSVTPFRDSPFDLTSATRGHIFRYASGRAVDGKVVVDASFPAPVTVGGMRIVWYLSRATAISALALDADGNWVTVMDGTSPGRASLSVLHFDHMISTTKLRLT